MTIENQYRIIVSELQKKFEINEARSMARRLLEHFLGTDRHGLLLGFKDEFPPEHFIKIQAAVRELENHRPLQYVTGKTWFMDHEFIVNEHVLIPRPETEQMVQAMIEDIRKLGKQQEPLKILDIGTGSGCIAISLSMAFEEASV